jgi:hypothetical protein
MGQGRRVRNGGECDWSEAPRTQVEQSGRVFATEDRVVRTQDEVADGERVSKRVKITFAEVEGRPAVSPGWVACPGEARAHVARELGVPECLVTVRDAAAVELNGWRLDIEYTET